MPPSDVKRLTTPAIVMMMHAMMLVQNQKGTSILLQEEFKSTLDDAHIDFLTDCPFDPCKWPEEEVNDAPEDGAMNLMTNDGSGKRDDECNEAIHSVYRPVFCFILRNLLARFCASIMRCHSFLVGL